MSLGLTIAQLVFQALFFVGLIVFVVMTSKKRSNAATISEVIQCLLGAAGTVLSFINMYGIITLK